MNPLQISLRTTFYACGVAMVAWLAMTFNWRAGPADPQWIALGIGLVLAIAGRQINTDASRRWNPDATRNVTAVAHIFAAITLGPEIAALSAFLGSFAVDSFDRRPLDVRLDNAITDGLSTLAAGMVLMATGAATFLDLPNDYGVLAGMAVAYTVVAQLTYAIATIAISDRVRTAVRDQVAAFLPEARTTLFECAMGIALGVVFRASPWALPAVLPAAFALYAAMDRGERLQRVTDQALETFAGIVDERDRYTFEHSTRVCDYAMMIGEELDLSEARLRRLYWTSRLHDLGKIAVDNTILNKPGGLTDEEFEVIKTHPVVSARILGSFTFDDYEADVVLCHHERYDGRGYLRRDPETVPFEAFIIAVADSFDAMTSDRTYRAKMTIADALVEVRANVGTQFHPRAAEAFLTAMARLGVREGATSVSTAELPRAGRNHDDSSGWLRAA